MTTPLRANGNASMTKEARFSAIAVNAVRCTAFALLACTSAGATQIEAVLSPGPLIEGHAKTESNCDNCHLPFKKGGQDSLCIACHKDAGRDIERKTGFHGRIKNRGECRSCHTDHRGRDARIVIASESTFDHAQTDYPLQDAHLKVRCANCHLLGKKYREALRTCGGCHDKDDNKKGHQGKFGSKCESCHTAKDWKTIRFDHDRDTKYALRGKHKQTRCAECHPRRLYVDKAPVLCNACHKKDDDKKGHKGKEGPRCQDCHFETDWKTTKNKFDHGLTVFPLMGKHAQVKCEKCHETQEFKQAKVACVACHRKDDDKVHKGRLGEICEDCHNAVDWKRWSFDHETRTRFALEGKHAKLNCYACHTQPVKGRALLPMTCAPCHSGDDEHAGRFGQDCGRCHTEQSWKDLRQGISRAAMPWLPALVSSGEALTTSDQWPRSMSTRSGVP